MSEPQDRLEDLLDIWESTRERGEEIPAEEICRDCPELLDKFQQLTQNLRAMPRKEFVLMPRRHALRDLALLAAGGWLSASPVHSASVESPFRVGKFERVYTPGPGKPVWHINDHAFARGPDDLWHVFGIAWPDPGEKPVPPRAFLEHATSRRLARADWARREPVLEMRPDLGETVMWAPHIVRRDGLFHLFVCTGGPDQRSWGISLATSKDLWTWSRVGTGPVVRDGFQARDPMVLWLPEERFWVMYYTATEDPAGGRHIVAYRTSADLRRWSDRQIAYRDTHRGTAYGPTESPFVVHYGRMFYLLIGPRPYDPPTRERPNYLHPGYVGTDVFASPDWRGWTDDQKVGHLAAHAPELVRDEEGTWYVSHAGVRQKGLYLARWEWQ